MAQLSAEAANQVQRAERRLRDRELRRTRLRQAAATAAQLLREEFGATRVLLFGSLLRAWFHEASDVDLACEGIAGSRLSEAQDRLIELIGEPVDLVALEEAEAGLRQRILASGEPL